MPEPTRRLTDNDGKWHLDKRVQVSHIVATVSACLAAFAYLSQMRQDIAVLQHQMTQQALRDERQDVQTVKNVDALQSQLLRIEDKLDRVIQRGR